MTDTLKALIQAAIKEDAPHGDITVSTLFTQTPTTTATLIAKQSGIYVGNTILNTCKNIIAPTGTINTQANDGQHVTNTDIIATIQAPLDQLLLMERTLLNIIQRLSGIATYTHACVQALNNPTIAICDTRKTTPGLRALEKEAVKLGGGTNHRFSLSDMILIKENHLKELESSQTLSDLPQLIQSAKQKCPQLKAEIEIETLDQLNTLDLSNMDYILLDNMNTDTLKKALTLCREKYPQAQIEVSGNVTLENIHRYKTLDIDRLSIGALTHSVTAFDCSLLIT